MIDERMEWLAFEADGARIRGEYWLAERLGQWLHERIDTAEQSEDMPRYTFIAVDGPRVFMAPDHEAIERAIHEGDMGYGDELPEGNEQDRESFAVSSDHGNLTVYEWSGEYWFEIGAWI